MQMHDPFLDFTTYKGNGETKFMVWLIVTVAVR